MVILNYLRFMKIIDGKRIQESIRAELNKRVEGLSIKPTLVIIQIGDNSASNIYIQNKKKFGLTVGIEVTHKKYKEDVSEKELLNDIGIFNNDASIHGIIVQLPIPKHLNQRIILEAVSPLKDADGLHSKSRAVDFWPATTRGILTILKYLNIDIEAKNILMIGSSALVGLPTSIALIKELATVTVANIKTKDLKELCLGAEIIISAVGKPGLITKDMVKAGQIIIDVGTTKVGDELKGDADFDRVKDIVEAITPVPGGVGPLTVASLFQNLLDLIEIRNT